MGASTHRNDSCGVEAFGHCQQIYVVMDISVSYCGVQINIAYCKCAYFSLQ